MANFRYFESMHSITRVLFIAVCGKHNTFLALCQCGGHNLFFLSGTKFLHSMTLNNKIFLPFSKPDRRTIFMELCTLDQCLYGLSIFYLPPSMHNPPPPPRVWLALIRSHRPGVSFSW